MAKVLGLDPGERRIGVSIADFDAGVATPLIVWPADEWRVPLTELVAEENVSTIVVGHPVPLGGGESESAARAVAFADEVATLVEDVDLVLFDERYTSKIAERDLIGRGVTREKRREILDKIAATVMLQGYLDSQS